MFKDYSAKHHQNNKERLQFFVVCKGYQSLSKEKKKRKKVTIWL